MLIIAGSYDRLLYGLELQETTENQSKKLEPVFIYPSHISSIKALDAMGRYLATGSSDEHLKIYDLVLRKEIGTLMHHNGTVNMLRFYQKSFLISCADDGTIGLIRTSDWELVKSLKGHNGPVLGLSPHPSGKLLVSVGKDKTLRTWDLTRGLLSLTQKLREPPSKIEWAGDYLVILYDKKIEIQSITDATITGTFESKSRINAVKTFVNSEKQDLIVFGGEDKTIYIINVNGTLISSLNAHETRIKDICVDDQQNLIGSCSSDGVINLYNFELQKLATYDCKTRLTCICFSTATPKKPQVVKKLAAIESDYEDAKPVVTVKFEKQKVSKKKKGKPSKSLQTKTDKK